MEAETTENNVPIAANIPVDVEGTESNFLLVLSKCGSCKEDLHNRSPKLLSCLHTFCVQCVNSFEAGESGQITCPVCRQVSLIANIIDNMFLPDHPVSTPSVAVSSLSAGANSDAGQMAVHMCTGCDENVSASYYCTECTEWLCEPCAQAHRRVKVTKDHVVEHIDQAVLGPAAGTGLPPGRRRGLMCPVHPQEQLKLYCDTCSRLTCRDCQLVEHKDHKYQFVQEAASSYKELLSTLLGKVKEKQAHIHNARTLIDRRHREISEKEKAVTNEVKTFVMSLIREINLKGRQLIGELQAICGAKRRQLEQKNTEVRLLSDNLEHGLRFAEYLLTNTDDAALLYSRRTLANQLSAILRTRCEVPNPYHVVDLRFAGNQTVSSTLSKLGCIIVDGYQYGNRNIPAPAAANGSSSATASAMQSSSSSAPASTKHLSNDQKLMLMQIRLGQRGHAGHQPQAAAGSAPAASGKQLFPPEYYGNSSVGSGAGHRLSHMPNQSSNISSSNQHQSLSSGGYIMPGRHSVPMGPTTMGYGTQTNSQTVTRSYQQGSISLAQLQQDRMRRERKENHQLSEFVSTSLQPIVIQPTDCMFDSQNSSDVSSSPSHEASKHSPKNCDVLYSIIKYSQTPTDNSHPNFNFTSSLSNDSRRASSANRVETNDGSFFKMLTEIKKEFKTTEVDSDANVIGSISTASTARSRTPTPRIESTNQDLISGDSPLSDAITMSNGIDQVVIGHQFSLADPIDFASVGNGEAMFMESGGEEQSSKSNEVNDWSAINETSVEVTAGLLNESGTDAEAASTIRECETESSRVTEDRNDDYCAVCRNGGDLLCCDRCPRVYHLKCHVPVLTAFPNPNATWLCTLCTNEDEKLRLDNPDARSAVGSKRRITTPGLSDKEQQVCEHLLLEIYTHESSVPFHEPVSKSVPNYYKIITSPMDFGTIRSRLNKQNFNHYQSIEDFVADVKLVFANCATFNPSTTEVGRCGIAVDQFFDTRVRQLLPFVDTRAMTPGSDVSDGSRPTSRTLKRRKLNSENKPSHGSCEGDTASLDGLDKDLAPVDNAQTNN